MYKTKVWNRGDELGGGSDHAFPHGGSPELEGLLELFKYLKGLIDFHFTIGAAIRRVAEFAKSGMSGSGIMPAVGGLIGEVFSNFVKMNFQRRIELLEQGSEVGRHDPAANQNDISFVHRDLEFCGELWLHVKVKYDEPFEAGLD